MVPKNKASYYIDALYECEENKELFATGDSEAIETEMRVQSAACYSMAFLPGFHGEAEALNCYTTRIKTYHDKDNYEGAVSEHNSFLDDLEFFEDFRLVKMNHGEMLEAEKDKRPPESPDARENKDDSKGMVKLEVIKKEILKTAKDLKMQKEIQVHMMNILETEENYREMHRVIKERNPRDEVQLLNEAMIIAYGWDVE